VGEMRVGDVRVHLGTGERPIATQFAYTYGEGHETGVVDTHHLTRAQAAKLHSQLGFLLKAIPPPDS
jgi:hypothetical protein